MMFRDSCPRAFELPKVVAQEFPECAPREFRLFRDSGPMVWSVPSRRKILAGKTMPRRAGKTVCVATSVPLRTKHLQIPFKTHPSRLFKCPQSPCKIPSTLSKPSKAVSKHFQNIPKRLSNHFQQNIKNDTIEEKHLKPDFGVGNESKKILVQNEAE